MNSSGTPRFQIFGALVLVQILFGINYVTSKVIVGVLPPLAWDSLRVAITAILLLGIALGAGKKCQPLKFEYLGPLSLYALLGIVINLGAFLTGLQYTTASNSAILNTLVPIFTLIIVTLKGQEPLSKNRVLGFLFAFLGVLVIRRVENFSLSDQTLLGDSLTLVNCISLSLFLVLSKNFVQKYDSIWTTTWLFILGSVGLGLLSIPSWTHFHFPPFNFTLIACMAYSIIGSTLVAYFLNLWALARVKSSIVALCIYLQPVVASLLAWAWFGEIITSRTLIASALIFTGILFATWKSPPLPTPSG